jgi:hypothetical protein
MNRVKPMDATTIAGLLDITQETVHLAPGKELNYFTHHNN